MPVGLVIDEFVLKLKPPFEPLVMSIPASPPFSVLVPLRL